MSRLEPLDPEHLDPAQRELLAAVESGPRCARHRRIGLAGPSGIWMRAPQLGFTAHAPPLDGMEDPFPDAERDSSRCDSSDDGDCTRC